MCPGFLPYHIDPFEASQGYKRTPDDGIRHATAHPFSPISVAELSQDSFQARLWAYDCNAFLFRF